MKTEKNKIATFLILALSAFAFTSCSKDDGDDANGGNSHKLVFKAEVSAGSSINQSVYGYDTSLTTVTGLGGLAWTSPEVTAPANARVASFVVNAVGANASSTLKLQVFVDGVLKKESTSTGTALVSQAQYTLR